MFNDANPYFSVSHHFTVYLSPWPQNQPLPSQMHLRSMQSTGIQLLSEVKELEANCLLQLRNLDNDAKAVVDFLKLQSRKVDLVLQHVLENEIQEGDKYTGLQFGGSGFTIQSHTQLALDSQYKASVFIHDELVAILCMAQITDCVIAPSSDATRADTHEQDTYHVSMGFSQILEADIEQLVKASLNVQQKQLKRRKLAKDEAIKD